MTDNLISHCDPALQPVATSWLTACKAKLLNVKITITFRDAAAQNAAHAAGLSKAGAGSSPHNICNADGEPASLAFDYAVMDDSGRYIKDGTDPRYAQAAQIALAIGQAAGLKLKWGGSWTPKTDGCNPDYDHIQIANWKDWTP